MMPLENSDKPTSDPELLLFPWEDIQYRLPPSPRSPAPQTDNDLAISNISSVLSARTYPYPVPGRPISREPREDLADVPIFGGIFIDSSSHEDDNGLMSASRDECIPYNQPAKIPPKRRRGDVSAAVSSSGKRGRPRKTTDHREGTDANERRRLQVRLAQRAYQSRREAEVSSLKNRISRLQASVERMSVAVFSFSNELAQSGILDFNSDLAAHWQNTLQTCLAQVKEAGRDDEGVPDTPQHSKASKTQHLTPLRPLQDQSSPRSTCLNAGVAPEINPPRLVNQGGILHPPTEDNSSPSTPPETPAFDLSTFIERLHVVCIYYGYLMLADPSVGLERLQKPFLFLLNIMDREHLTAYFEAALNARVSRRPLEQWTEVPFFKLGNAGTHYPQSTTTVSLDYPYRAYRKHKTVEDPLSRYPPEIREKLSGEWFDMYDLKEYLREKGVHLFTYPPREDERNTSPAVNMAKLTKALVNRAMCLGRTPGFRRFDVEEALRSAIWT